MEVGFIFLGFLICSHFLTSYFIFKIKNGFCLPKQDVNFLSYVKNKTNRIFGINTCRKEIAAMLLCFFEILMYFFFLFFSFFPSDSKFRLLFRHWDDCISARSISGI